MYLTHQQKDIFRLYFNCSEEIQALIKQLFIEVIFNQKSTDDERFDAEISIGAALFPLPPSNRENEEYIRLDKFFYDQLKRGCKFDNDQCTTIKVIGNGNGLTNVRKGETGEIISVKDSTYTIKWSNGIVEQKDISGGMAVDLDVILKDK